MSKSAQVFMLSHEQPPMLGGAGVVAHTVYTGLQAQGVNIKKSAAAVSFSPFIARVIGFFYAIYALCSDVIILNDLYYKKVWLTLFKGRCCKRCIIYLHGSEPEFLLNDSRYHRAFIRMCVSAKKVVAVSDYMQHKLFDCITDENDKAALANNIQVVRNGIDTNCFALQSAKDNTRPFTFITASRVVKEKGFSEVAHELAKLKQQGEQFQWHIAGDGPYLQELKEQVRALGLTSQVQFLGRLSQTQLADAFNQADVFVLLSNLQESLGLVFMEASSCGCWSIGYNRYGAKEAILPGETGQLINAPSELADAVFNFRRDHNVTRATISAKAQTCFSSNATVDQLRDMILGTK
ncbi:glycosyltransferase family 4 protein [Pseudoalteromonas ruthenica]|uniref:glycosyltransferase family 4 protein n=1 Tax=Pseudoalteromonas ruthenica TaxID=151081 RepID=UPI00110A8D96|nr:glycosyltransferase family 4 protein [Pseudoalteromonas ruthenica]TMO46495.1 hypothetical protein CWC24_10365 [Pseudoalteromonas ruthenica]TMO50334.1 hypothetical protein CWC23_11420 [Pseudoalteromonas ruthenica]